MTRSVFDVVDYNLVTGADQDGGDPITPLKLQKLIYYCQGFHLAAMGKPLFSDRIEAWDLGPVVRCVWDKYKGYGSSAIARPSAINLSAFRSDQIALMGEVYRVYGRFTAWRLSQMTHEERPWLNGRERLFKEISHEDMRSYFKTRLKK